MVVALDIPTLGSVAAFVAIAACVAWAEIALRRASRRSLGFLPSPSHRQPAMTARRAQAIYERMLFIVAPAVVSAGIALARHVPVGVAAVLFVTMLAVCAGLWPRQSYVRLMPVARFGLRFVLPSIAIGIVLLPGLFDPWDFTPSKAVPSLVGAWLIVGLGIWLERAFDADRPIRLAVIGSRELASKLAAEMRQLRVRDYVVVGFIGTEPQPAPDEDADEVLPWLGEIDEVRDVVQVIGIDLLAVGPESPRLQVFETTANACLDLPVRMLEASAFYEEVLGHVPIGQINSAWFQCIMHPRYSPTSPLSKRLLDLAIALPVAVLVALPLVPLLALAVRLSDGGPAFFRQRRVGEQGREFDIIKLRTMRVDAAELSGIVAREELVTSLGRLLRRSHLDELPQLWNVIRGNMTLVGPRPEQPALVEELSRVVPYYQRRSLVKPGVTGWAQVRCGYAGSQVGTAWKICHDLYYVKRRSIVFDVLILAQTLHIGGDSADQELEAPADDFILGEAASLVTR